MSLYKQSIWKPIIFTLELIDCIKHTKLFKQVGKKPIRPDVSYIRFPPFCGAKRARQQGRIDRRGTRSRGQPRLTYIQGRNRWAAADAVALTGCARAPGRTVPSFRRRGLIRKICHVNKWTQFNGVYPLLFRYRWFDVLAVYKDTYVDKGFLVFNKGSLLPLSFRRLPIL